MQKKSIFNHKVPFLLLWIFFAIYLFVENSYAATHEERTREEASTPSSSMRFKVGFEFQEISGLCSWALHDAVVQRNPLFEMYESHSLGKEPRSLWTVVIDTNDIEFVTSPFSDHDQDLLDECMGTISSSFQALETLLSVQESVTFNEWTEKIEGLCCHPLYKFVYDKPLTRKDGWNPRFSPQITIQHPLEWTIPLYYGLLGFDCPEMVSFACAFPYRDILVKAIKEGDSERAHQIFADQGRKINGLVFLHALTLVQMTPIEDDDAAALQETLDSLQSYNQVDAKMKLSLMSRRPFSSMYRDICPFLTIPYSTYFQESILKFNNNFTSFAEVPSLFNKTNYGEQFLDINSRSPMSFKKWIPFFKDPFFQENEEIITSLLDQGVITTAMIRNSKKHESLLETYFPTTLAIFEDQHSRFSINVAAEEDPLVMEQCVHDALSPPWFLNEKDSMGRIKDDISEENKLFGEAIVEVRSIKNVGKWFLKRAGLDKITLQGHFLDNPSKIGTESMKLFGFLKSFTIKDFDGIYMGVTYALVKY